MVFPDRHYLAPDGVIAFTVHDIDETGGTAGLYEQHGRKMMASTVLRSPSKSYGSCAFLASAYPILRTDKQTLKPLSVILQHFHISIDDICL